MCWTALSAIGTIIAAFVGIAGIWLNIWDKKKRLKASFEAIPSFSIYISNASLRSVIITKIVCTVDNHVFYVKVYDGLQEVCLNPASVKKIEISKQEIYDEYYKCQLDALCNPNDEVVMILHDNYDRKYKIKTGFGISAFKY